jgi:hypothetical protein
MKVEIDYKHGQAIYLKHDPEQSEYRLNRIILGQKNLITLELLNSEGELIEVDEIHCNNKKDVLKASGIDEPEE